MVFLMIVSLVATWSPGFLQIKLCETYVPIFIGSGIQKMVYQSSQYRKWYLGTQEPEWS